MEKRRRTPEAAKKKRAVPSRGRTARTPKPVHGRPGRTPPPKPQPLPGPERLQKIISRAGIASRRKAEDLIRGGHVSVNGQVVSELGVRADPRRDRISVDGRPLHVAAPNLYVMLHKPVGVVTTLSDPEGRPTVRDFVAKLRSRVFPVGRLDYHSSGLLLLTNDGEMAQRLMHPRYGVPKTYWAKVKGVPTAETLKQLASGVRLEEGKTGPATVRLMRSRGEKAWLEITIAEGRRREVRRMCEKVGHPVEKLSRVRLGPLHIGKLRPGEFKELSLREIRDLREAVGLD